MKSWIIRCAGCGKEYLYRPHRKGSVFVKEYCPDCWVYLEEAFAKMHLRFVPRWKEIAFGEGFEFGDVNEMRRRIDSIHNNISDGGIIQSVPVEFVPEGMKSGEVLIYSHVKYALCADASGLEHVFVWQEYDLDKEAFGEKPWLVDYGDDVYRLQEPLSIDSFEVGETELPDPEGKLMHMQLLSDESHNGCWKSKFTVDRG